MKKNIWQKLRAGAVGLAPLAGITDSPFRQLCRQYGADFVISEMVSAAGVYYEEKKRTPASPSRQKNKSLDIAFFTEAERPYIVQIFGNDPAQMAAAAEIINAKFKPDGIDINMGCPVRKIVKNGSGAALLKDPLRAVAITKAVKNAVGPQIPISVKTRLGFQEKTIGQLAPQLEQAGADALIIHGRLQTQFFSGPVDFEAIRKVVTAVSIPVFANGGITDFNSQQNIMNKTGAAGTLIGQAARGNPFVFKKIKAPSYQPSWEEIKNVIREHTKQQIKFRHNETFALTEMRKHYGWYIRGIKNAASWRQKLVRVKTLTEVENILKAI